MLYIYIHVYIFTLLKSNHRNDPAGHEQTVNTPTCTCTYVGVYMAFPQQPYNCARTFVSTQNQELQKHQAYFYYL